MIYAKSTEIGNQVKLELSRPDKSGNHFVTVGNYAEAERLMYTLNRDYVVEKITGWLKMRKHALELSDRKRLSIGTAELTVVMGYHKHASFAGVCRLVRDHSGHLEEIAPSEQSKHYGHYQRVIMPIIKYCRDNG